MKLLSSYEDHPFLPLQKGQKGQRQLKMARFTPLPDLPPPVLRLQVYLVVGRMTCLPPETMGLSMVTEIPFSRQSQTEPGLRCQWIR